MTTLLKPAGPAVSAGPAPTPTPRRRSARSRKRAEIALFVGPALILFLGFVILPVILAAVYSFYNLPQAFQWDDLADPARFIGLQNYVRALNDPVFLGAVGHNFFILGASLLIQGPIAIGVALLLNRRIRGRAALRLLIFVPYVLAEVTVGIMWQLLLQPDGGVDAFLTRLGLEQFITGWLANLEVVRWTMLFILTWKYTGFALILFLAGLSNIPDELNEAAAIDGASWWQTQRYVTLPLLGPTIRIWIFLSMIGSLQQFDVIWVASAPAVRSLGASNTMATYMVDHGFNQREWGYGNAVALILFVISFVAALIFQRFVLRRDIQGAQTRGVA